MNSSYVQIAAALLLTLFGSVSLQAASPSAPTVPPVKALPVAVPPGTQSAASSAPVTSVLERFRTHTGTRTPAAMTALFTAPVTTTIRQQPEVALSDGATMIRITIAAGAPDSKAPNVAFDGAKLILLTRNNTGEWEIEALPAAGAMNISLTLLTDSGTREIPLSVAPALPAGTDLSEKGFIAFLGGSNAAALPLLDLNGDGRRDYLDDYIFTANYLVRPISATDVQDAVQITAPQPPATDKTAEKRTPGAGRASSQPSVLPGGQNPAVQSSESGQTPYQRNLSIRNQRAREQSERLRGKAPEVPPAQ